MAPENKGKVWADQPFELIETPEFSAKNTKGPDQDYILAASYMTLMNNILIRGLNSIYQQAPHVTPADQKDFINYSLCFCEVLDNHLRGQEVYLFPEIEKAVGKKGLMDFNKEDYDQITTHLPPLKTHLLTLLLPSPTTPFSPPHLLSLLTNLSTPLLTHLRAQIPQLLSLSHFGTSLPIKNISTQSGQTITGQLAKESGFMFFLLNNDVCFEGGRWSKWPPIPGLVRWGLVRGNVGRNKGWWRFACCGQDGKPRDLFAVG